MKHDHASLNPVVLQRIKKTFRKRVFQLIYEGYVRLKNNDKDYSQAIEEAISHDLKEEIEKFSEDDNLPRKFQQWVQKFSVYCESPISPHGEIGRRRPRLDIRFRSGERPFPTFVFEAKRLYSASKSADYFGNNGIERFWNETGYPVNTFGEAGMLGYIQNKDVTYWIDSLKKQFEKRRGALHACEHSNWEPAIQIKELQHTFYTQHQPTGKKEVVIIFHLLLLFR